MRRAVSSGLQPRLATPSVRYARTQRQYTTAPSEPIASPQPAPIAHAVPHPRVGSGHEILRAIHTLDPKRLTSADYLELNARPNIWDREFLFALDHKTMEAGGRWRRPQAGKTEHVARLLYRSTAAGLAGSTSIINYPFPPHTNGFLYYCVPPHAPPTAGEIRFRVTGDGDPRSFARGADVLLPHDFPWRIPLITAASAGSYRMFHDILLRDGLVSPSLMEYCQSFGQEMALNYDSKLIYSFGQPFVVDFAQGTFRFWTLDEDALYQNDLFYCFSDRPINGKRMQPYSGSAICCFERSTLPEHADRRMVVLRFVKIIEPAECDPRYDGYVRRPVEGELLWRGGRTWACDVDKRPLRLAALRVLFDHEKGRVVAK